MKLTGVNVLIHFVKCCAWSDGDGDDDLEAFETTFRWNNPRRALQGKLEAMIIYDEDDGYGI